MVVGRKAAAFAVCTIRVARSGIEAKDLSTSYV